MPLPEFAKLIEAESHFHHKQDINFAVLYAKIDKAIGSKKVDIMRYLPELKRSAKEKVKAFRDRIIQQFTGHNLTKGG